MSRDNRASLGPGPYDYDYLHNSESMSRDNRAQAMCMPLVSDEFRRLYGVADSAVVELKGGHFAAAENLRNRLSQVQSQMANKRETEEMTNTVHEVIKEANELLGKTNDIKFPAAHGKKSVTRANKLLGNIKFPAAHGVTRNESKNPRTATSMSEDLRGLCNKADAAISALKKKGDQSTAAQSLRDQLTQVHMNTVSGTKILDERVTVNTVREILAEAEKLLDKSNGTNA